MATRGDEALRVEAPAVNGVVVEMMRVGRPEAASGEADSADPPITVQDVEADLSPC